MKELCVIICFCFNLIFQSLEFELVWIDKNNAIVIKEYTTTLN
jgi:hypothetical protein